MILSTAMNPICRDVLVGMFRVICRDVSGVLYESICKGTLEIRNHYTDISQ